MPIVDAHPHIYSPDRASYSTIDEPWEPGEPASAEDLKKAMDAVGVDRAVFIQTSTFYGHDNRYVMDSAKAHAEWATGVVTLDPDNPSHVDLLEDAVANSNIRGLRGTTDSISRIATPSVRRLWSKAMELGIPVNCMVMDDLDRVPEIELMAQDLGDLKIVIDHCFMLNTRQKTEETLLALERLAKLPNVYAKLTSGTHGSYRVYPHVDMHEPLKRVIAAFGPERCVWGSNFPNALWSKGTSYAQNLHLFVKELGLGLPEKAAILGGTAMSLWFPREHDQAERASKKRQEQAEREVIMAQDEQDEEADTGDGESAEAEDNGHVAEITRMADLISSEGDVEGPILDQVDEEELTAILDAASGLDTVLGAAGPAGSASKADVADPAEESVAQVLTGEDYEPAAEDVSEPALDDEQIEVEDDESAVHMLADSQSELDADIDSESDEVDWDEIEVDDDVIEADPAAAAQGIDISSIQDAAEQLGSLLESVEGIGGSINDLAADIDEEGDSQAERPSA